MSYVNLEISFKTTDSDLLDTLPTLAELTSASAFPDTGSSERGEESFWLSTCNRVELFVGRPDDAVRDTPERVLARFARSLGRTPAELSGAYVARRGFDAVEHLARLAAGLESVAVGEEQIVGQVRSAFAAARAAGSTGPLLTRAFDHAMHVAKRVRTETALGRMGISLLQHGLAEVARELGGLRGRSVLVVGLGAIGTQAVVALRAAGAAPVRVAGRTAEGSDRFVARHGGVTAVHVADVERVAAHCDLVVTASSAREPLLTAAGLSAARAGTTAPLHLLDLARPRDVEPACADLPGVRLTNIELLSGVLGAHGEVADELDRALAVVAEETARFTARSTNASAGVLVRAMRSTVNAIVEAELVRLERRLPALGPAEIAEAGVALHRLAGKVLHEPLVHARSLSGTEDTVYIDALTKVFGPCPQIHGERHVGRI